MGCFIGASWSLAVQPDRMALGEDDSAWLDVILAPGSSIGGTGALWIATFPSRNDTVGVGLWEYLIHQLAGEAGISVPPARI